MATELAWECTFLNVICPDVWHKPRSGEPAVEVLRTSQAHSVQPVERDVAVSDRGETLSGAWRPAGPTVWRAGRRVTLDELAGMPPLGHEHAASLRGRGAVAAVMYGTRGMPLYEGDTVAEV